MKKGRDAGFSSKRSGNAGSGPPLPDPVLSGTYQRILAILAQNLALDDKNNRGILSQALCVIGSLGNLMFKLHISPQTTFSG